jgi:uncharacterized membrane protein YgcG
MNYASWNAQVRAAVHGARLQGHLTGTAKAPEAEVINKVDGKDVKMPNLAYEEWEASDQQVLGCLLSSLSKEVLTHVSPSDTAAEAWTAIEQMFGSQVQARTVNTRIALSTTKKGNMTITKYFSKMKVLGDEMAAPLDDEELGEHIITGLSHDYAPLVSALIARVEPVLIGELYSQLLQFETRMDLTLGGSSANSANRGRGNSRGTMHGQGGSCGRGRSQSRGRPLCQVCFKKGHTAADCWHRFDEDY